MRSKEHKPVFYQRQPLNKEVVIRKIFDGKEKFNRYLAEIWLKAKKTNVNDLLVNKGFAFNKEY